jgi:hypothetical protein
VVSITRASEWKSRFRAFKVLIDGNVVGRLKNGETQVFATPAGRHACVVQIDWCASQPLEIEVPDRGQVELECGHRRLPWWAGPIYNLVMHDQIVYLRPKGQAAGG